MKLEIPEVIFFAGSALYFIIRGVFESRIKHAGAVVRRVPRLDIPLLFLMGVGVIILPVVYLITNFISFADYRLPDALQWFGVLVMTVALVLFWRSHADLAENFSRTLEIREGHRLVTHGVYRFVRHPMYAAIWLFSLAQGLMLQNWLAGWSALAAFALMYFVRINDEERMMEEVFGQAYREHRSRTGRIIPRVRRR